jgi:hypothetical protein
MTSTKLIQIRRNGEPGRQMYGRMHCEDRSRNQERERRTEREEREGGHTAHVGKLAEGVGVHLGAQPQQGTDDGRRRRHVSVACGCAGYSGDGPDGVVREVPEEECLTYLLLDLVAEAKKL